MRYIAETDVAVRYETGEPDRLDETSGEAAYRECARRLKARPEAHRVEAWIGGRCVTYARRGVVVQEAGR